ncbi:ABC transporter permease subunit [Candidatus Caldatribacterium saccharofermentans]|uniref:Maltose/maltodextrin transport system permease protein MalG n=1 Tax=Candidatus Caldatribacterium saccharofermentans TaxID=1454753 RepID=A0A7V4WMD5_9BACT
MQRKTLRLVLVYLVCILIAAFTLFPIYWMFVVSARTKLEVFSGPKLIQTSFYAFNYYRPFFRDIYGRYLVNSLIIASGNTLLVVSLAILATYAFSRFRVPGSSNLFFWTITNRMAPPAVFIVPFFLIFTRLGLRDTRIGMILLYCIFNLPFAIWLLKGMIDSIPKELDEAAYIDGCSLLGVLWNVILPLAKPGIMTTAILTWIFAWNEYLFAAILTSVNARTITTGLAEFVTVIGTNWGEMAAVSVVCLIPAVVFIGIAQRHIIAGLTFGAVKD